MAKIYKMPDKTKEALASGKEMKFRMISNYCIIDRILTPIGASIDSGNVTLYKDTKKLYLLSMEDKKKSKEELLKSNLEKLFPHQEKRIQTISTIGDRVSQLIERLEINGFKLID